MLQTQDDYGARNVVPGYTAVYRSLPCPERRVDIGPYGKGDLAERPRRGLCIAAT